MRMARPTNSPRPHQVGKQANDHRNENSSQTLDCNGRAALQLVYESTNGNRGNVAACSAEDPTVAYQKGQGIVAKQPSLAAWTRNMCDVTQLRLYTQTSPM